MRTKNCRLRFQVPLSFSDYVWRTSDGSDIDTNWEIAQKKKFEDGCLTFFWFLYSQRMKSKNSYWTSNELLWPWRFPLIYSYFPNNWRLYVPGWVGFKTLSNLALDWRTTRICLVLYFVCGRSPSMLSWTYWWDQSFRATFHVALTWMGKRWDSILCSLLFTSSAGTSDPQWRTAIVEEESSDTQQKRGPGT